MLWMSPFLFCLMPHQNWAATWDFQQCGMCDQQGLRLACTYTQSDQSLCWLLEYSMNTKLLTKHYLEPLSLKGGGTGWPESTLVKMPHCWKSHVTAQIIMVIICPICISMLFWALFIIYTGRNIFSCQVWIHVYMVHNTHTHTHTHSSSKYADKPIFVCLVWGFTS